MNEKITLLIFIPFMAISVMVCGFWGNESIRLKEELRISQELVYCLRHNQIKYYRTKYRNEVKFLITKPHLRKGWDR